MNQQNIGNENVACHGVNIEQAKSQREGTTTKAFLPPDFDNLEEYLLSLTSFLKTCEPFINLMIVDYFTTNSWETRMPKDWREAFESKQGKLSSLDLMELVSLGKLRDFKAGPSSPDSDLQNVSQQVPSDGSANTEDKDNGPQDWPESLKEFIGMINKLSIHRTLDPDFTKYKDTLDIHLIPGMTPKKLHEVEILSGLIASYAKDHNIRSVIDLGAGQGYLSRVLAFQHQLCVLGVDSNTIQTCGAQTTQKRTERLFLNKTRSKISSGGAKKSQLSGSKKSQSSSRSSIPTSPTQPSASEESLSAPGPSETSNGHSEPNSATNSIHSKEISLPKLCEKTKVGSQLEGNNSEDSTGCNESSSNNTSPCKKSSSRSRKPKAKNEDCQNIPSSKSSTNTKESKADTLPDTIASTPTSECTDPKQGAYNDDSEHFKTKANSDPANDPNLATTPGSNFQLQHITQHITASTLPTLLKEHFPKKPKNIQTCCGQDQEIEEDDDEEEEEEEERWTLCGLHACGDLTSTMVKLYLESSATCLFSVGCCYHWISEKYDSDGNIVISDGSHGFPLSDAFNRHKVHLGEHARMTACQSPERWLKYQKETEDAIHGHYYRALLHKLMVERGLYPGPPAIAPVLGRMGKHRLKGFPHYLITAVNRLRLPTDVIQPEEAQEAYANFLERDLYRIGILWALRTMLGPLFEGMILLDRATFLHENIVGDEGKGKHTKVYGRGKGSVQLVAGFDVVESPRNMILIALKD
ncbi:Methyltransferase-like protein 25 [Entomortierella beljakovae]|nr:Methyltransferase-like protein 25 [Entomortierella beljakovae]